MTFWPPSPGALQIENSEESDQGKYECVAVNSAGTRYSAPANLYVRGKMPLEPERNPPCCHIRSPPPAGRSSLGSHSSPMTANGEFGSLASAAVKVKPVDTCLCSHTAISCTLYLPVCLVFVSWVVIYVFGAATLLFFFLTCLPSQRRRGCFHSSGVEEVGCGSAFMFWGGGGLHVESC